MQLNSKQIKQLLKQIKQWNGKILLKRQKR